MNTARNALGMWMALAGASIRSQMQYRTVFIVRVFVDFALLVADFAPVWILVDHFGALRGWTLAELALLYGMVSISWGIIEGGLRGFENFGPFLIEGTVDRWLLRPRSVILQVASHVFEIRKVGRILQGVLVLAVAIAWLELSLTAVAWIAFGVAGGIIFFAGIVIGGAATQFWTLGHTAELQNMLTYGGSAALTYPMSAYSRWFRRVLTYAVPLAFVNYFPAVAALGRTRSEGWPAWVPWLSPLFCTAVLLGGLQVFAIGLRRYESTGS